MREQRRSRDFMSFRVSYPEELEAYEADGDVRRSLRLLTNARSCEQEERQQN
jgi:hypothetical protein